MCKELEKMWHLIIRNREHLYLTKIINRGIR